jgi:hypothetical protein
MTHGSPLAGSSAHARVLLTTFNIKNYSDLAEYHGLDLVL